MNDLKERFEQALAPEPPFQTDLVAALDAAVRGGRRRRVRAAASRTLVVATCAAVVGGAVVAVLPNGSPAPVTASLFGPASSSSPSGRSGPGTCGTKPSAPFGSTRVAPLTDVSKAPNAQRSPAASLQLKEAQAKAEAARAKALAQDLLAGAPTPGASVPNPLFAGQCESSLMLNGHAVHPADVSAAVLATGAKAVAASVGAGTITMDPVGVAVVRTHAGTYSVSVAVWAEKFDPQTWADKCSPSTAEAKPCRVESRSPQDLARSTQFTDGSGRASLQYVASAGTDAAGSPLTVDVTIDNYVEQASGPKTVGPTWQQLGFTPAGIRAAIASTGEFS